MALTPQMIQAMNAASGNNVSTTPGAPPSRADQIRAIGQKAAAPAASAPAPKSPSNPQDTLGAEDARQVIGGFETAKKGVEEGAKMFADPKADAGEKALGLAHAGAQSVIGAGQSIFAPVAATITRLAQSASDNPIVQGFANSPVVSAFLDAANKGEDAAKAAWQNLAQAHPDIARTIADASGVALTVLGGEEAPAEDVGKSLNDAAATAKDAAGKVKESMRAPEAPPKSEEPVAPPKPAAEKPNKVVSTVTEAIRNAGKNISNYAEDAQKSAAAREEVRAKGPEAVNVVDETGSSEFMRNIDNTKSAEDLKAKAAMLETAAKHPDLGGTGSRALLPRQVIADQYIAPRVSLLQARLDQLGKVIGGAKENSGRVDTGDLVTSMIAEAKKQGVIVKPNQAGFTFSKAPGVSGIDATRIKTIRSMFEGFRPNKAGKYSAKISDLAQTRKNFSDMTNRSDAAKEVVSGGGEVDNARRLIAQKIGSAYHKATQDYHSIATVLEKLDPKQELKLSEEGAAQVRKMKLGDYARRLLSNNASQAKAIFTSLDELAQQEAKRLGKKLPKQDLEDLVDTAGAIEEGLGITPRNSFFGQVSGGVKNGLGEIPTSISGAIGKVADIVTKSKTSPERSLRALQAYVAKVIKDRGAK